MVLPTHFQLRVANGKTVDIPSVGFGTWQASEGGWCKDAVLAALKAGYRHLDCAWSYGVDGEIGEAIRESGVPREEIFITSKFWPHFAAPENTELAIDKVLKGMGLEYIDLWLIHWCYVLKPISRAALEKAIGGFAPSPEEKGILKEDDKLVFDYQYCPARIAKSQGKEGSFIPTWHAMESLVRKGKARSIGLSNFTIADIKEILPHLKDVPISCNQIEVHPWLPQNDLVAFGKEHNILTTCYSPLAQGQKINGTTLLQTLEIVKLAEKNEMDAGQLLQSWAVQRGTVPLGKSSTPSRIASNLKVKELSQEDMKIINDLEITDGSGRTVNPTEELGLPFFEG